MDAEFNRQNPLVEVRFNLAVSLQHKSLDELKEVYEWIVGDSDQPKKSGS